MAVGYGGRVEVENGGRVEERVWGSMEERKSDSGRVMLTGK
jgi:hypothetical protein